MFAFMGHWRFLFFLPLLGLVVVPGKGSSLTDVATPTGGLGEAGGEPASQAEAILQKHQRRLREEFDDWLQQPEAFRTRVLAECGAFPEGRIYSFAIPALAYANLGLAHPQDRRRCADQMQKLLAMLIQCTTQDIAPPDGDLLRLRTYQKQGTRLATLNLALACHALVSADPRFNHLHEHLSRLLREGLVELNGQPLASYPEYTWYFDTAMALLSLELWDRAHAASGTQELTSRHLAWRNQFATDPLTYLPIAHQGGKPRGCDLSMQICLWQQIAPFEARRLYDRYVQHFWSDLGLLAGFREWPRSLGMSLLGDIDSGPLVLGLGPTASGIGIAAAQAVGDERRKFILARELDGVPQLLPLVEPGMRALFGAGARISHRYMTGFLYGDAMLFYAVTWVPYPEVSGMMGRPPVDGTGPKPVSPGGGQTPRKPGSG